jgi:D-3-phosphoglycerate dehydrogenase
MTCWAPVSAAAIAASRALSVVARMGVVLDNIAIDAATERSVLVVTCLTTVSSRSQTMRSAWSSLGHGALPGPTARSQSRAPGTRGREAAAAGDADVRGGRLRRIGRMTARKLAGLAARVVASDPFPPADTHGIHVVPLDELLRSSDAVIVHAPLTPATRHLISSRELSLMPRGGSVRLTARRHARRPATTRPGLRFGARTRGSACLSYRRRGLE